MLSLRKNHLIHLVTVFLLLFCNFALYKNFFSTYPPSFIHIIYGLSLTVLLFFLFEFLLHLVCYRYTIKPVLITVLLVASASAYFMNQYNVVIDPTMVGNVMATSSNEAADLFNFKMVLYVVLLGIIPSIFILRVKIIQDTHRRELFVKGRMMVVAILVIASQLFIFGKFYGSFFREHKALRYYANPAIVFYSAISWVNSTLRAGDYSIASLGTDAAVSESDVERELVIMVVGETARADHFSLNGYQKDTNPLLAKEKVYSFNHFQSCGTATAVSVPCMFSHLEQDSFDENQAHHTENLLDILHHAGVNVLWRDNNSDSKHVALRVPYEDFRTPEKNPVCDDECRDVGMLSGLKEYIDSQKTGDIMIVLHQMGNHGPAYYKRYPAEFEAFTPVCKTNELENCSQEEISNGYDNAIRYTDYFLARVIGLLKQYDNRFETSMVYISDHGESLGEKGIYLHGLPDFMAPEEQRHVGAIFWFGKHYDDIDFAELEKKKTQHLNHDYLFHTILGLFEIECDVYSRKMDMIAHTETRQDFR